MKQQNELDPYLTSFYPVFSLVSNMTSPNLEQETSFPEIISFMANIDYIPEGESDMTKVSFKVLKKRDYPNFALG